jgi:branched-chain amino acid transport system ATP-binding protein
LASVVALSIRDITAGYSGHEVLSGVSLDVVAGRLTAVVGANGAGKSTLLKSALGYAEIMAGEIVLDGRAISRNVPSYQRARLGIGYMPQQAGLFPELTVEENLIVPLFGDRQPNRECAAMLAKLDRLSALRYRSAAHLSGGEKQLAGVAATLIMRPRVVLVDEPLANLTETWAEAVMALLRDSSRNEGTAVLIVEHNFDAIRQYIQELVILRLGSVSYRGSPELLDSKQDLSLAMLGEVGNR